MQSRTFLPVTPWVPVDGLRVAFEVRAAPEGVATTRTTWYSEDGATWPGWADSLAHAREWKRFGVVFRVDGEGGE